MSVYVDTSALLAVMVQDGLHHEEASAVWDRLLDGDERLLTSNYVILELCSILQKRFGMSAVHRAVRDILPPVEVLWVDRMTHDTALVAMVAANRRALSLVDCVSLAVMRQEDITTALTLDPHFAEHGFDVLPDVQCAGTC